MIIKLYRTFEWRFWRFGVQRYDPWNPEISVLWRDDYDPPCYHTLFRLRGDGTECEVCAWCMKQFNYRLTERDLFIHFLWKGQIKQEDRREVTELARRINSKERMKEGELYTRVHILKAKPAAPLPGAKY